MVSLDRFPKKKKQISTYIFFFETVLIFTCDEADRREKLADGRQCGMSAITFHEKFDVASWQIPATLLSSLLTLFVLTFLARKGKELSQLQ